MKYTKTNKIIAFILSMVMILTNVFPSITSEVFGAETKTPEPLVEYSDSNQTEPERENTETDIDNFKFYLDYGTISDKIFGDTLFIKDTSNKINATLRVEYTGNKRYNAGDLTMTFNYPTGIKRENSSYDMLSDVGAELKGSNSGRGDWYYEKKLGKLTFTNKKATTGSFTSSIEIVLEMPEIREVVSGFNSTMSASFSVNGFDSILNSKTLFFSTKTTHDELILKEIRTSQYIYRTYSTDSSTYVYGDCKLDDYYIFPVSFIGDTTYYNRGCNEINTITVPEDCLIFRGTVNQNSNTYTGSFYNMHIAVPKNKYTTDDQITITWDRSAVFFDEGETWEDRLVKTIPIIDNQIIVKPSGSLGEWKGNTTKSSNRNYFNFYEFGKGGGTNFSWKINLSSNSAYSRDKNSYAPKYTEIIDENTCLYPSSYTIGKDCKIRDFREDEYYLTYIQFSKRQYTQKGAGYNVSIYAKKDSDAEYTFIDSFDYNNSKDIKVDLDTSQKYTDFKIVIDGNWLNTHTPDINIGAFVNILDFSHGERCVYNEATYKEIVNNGEYIEKNIYDSIYVREGKFIVKSRAYTSEPYKYYLKDSKVNYNMGVDGYFNTPIDVSHRNLSKIHKLSFDVSIPSYMNFSEVKKEQISIRDAIYNENDNSLVSNKNISDFFDFDYNIIQKEKEKILSINITIKDGYYIYPEYNISDKTYSDDTYKCGNFSFENTLYMDFDTYSNLLNIGKLPSGFNFSITNYRCEDFSSSGIAWNNDSSSSKSYYSIPSLAGSTYQGVEKFVNTGSGFTKDLSETTPGGDYSYKLRIAGGETLIDSIVLYDNLEEAYDDNKYWKGTFNGLDTTLLDMIYEGEDYTYTVYYSKDKNQTFDLSTAGWVKETDWTDSLADVKSIAIDLGDLRLKPKSLAYVIVNMKAPQNSNPGLKAYNSYAADYKAYDSTTGVQLENIEVLPSNTTEVVYNKNITYTVNKVWDGEPGDSVEIKLFANGKEKETVTLNADNGWTHTFTDLPALDDSFSPIEYSVEETILKLYNASYETVTDKNGNISTIITNTRVPDIYTITKKWNINSDKIKINVKTENGYDAEYDYINLLDSDGSVLEKIEFEKLGLAVSKSEYMVDKTYTAEVHMKDGSIYKTPVNVNKFNVTPVEFDLYVEGYLVDTFVLDEENDWSYTTIHSNDSSLDEDGKHLSDGKPHSVKEKTKGDWKSEITYTEYDNHINYTIINNVDYKIEILTITVPDLEPPVETGNNNYLLLYFFALGTGFTGIIITKKKKA